MSGPVFPQNAVVVKSRQPVELEELIIYFQNRQQSDGGDVDDSNSQVLEGWDRGSASSIICFEEQEACSRVLAKEEHHFVDTNGRQCQLAVEPYISSKHSPSSSCSALPKASPETTCTRKAETAGSYQQLSKAETVLSTTGIPNPIYTKEFPEELPQEESGFVVVQTGDTPMEKNVNHQLQNPSCYPQHSDLGVQQPLRHETVSSREHSNVPIVKTSANQNTDSNGHAIPPEPLVHKSTRSTLGSTDAPNDPQVNYQGADHTASACIPNSQIGMCSENPTNYGYWGHAAQPAFPNPPAIGAPPGFQQFRHIFQMTGPHHSEVPSQTMVQQLQSGYQNVGHVSSDGYHSLNDQECILHSGQPIGQCQETMALSAGKSSRDGIGPPPGVLVQGIGVKMSKDHLEMYLENEERCGGGPILDLHYTPGTGKAIVYYKDAMVAAKVVRKKTLVLKDSTVTVSWAPDPSATNQIQDTILVTGIKSTTKEEVLEMYFENEKRSGGGCIKKLTYTEGQGKAEITFDEPEVAANLVKAGRGNMPLDDAVLQICWPTTCASQEKQIQDTILVTGIRSTTKEDVLEMYFESEKRSGGGHIKKLAYTEGQGKAEITFGEPEVAANLVKAGTGKIPLEDAVLQICWPTTCASQEKQIQDTILVTGIRSTTKEEVLEMYFESEKRSGGGRIKKLAYTEGQGKAEITFSEPEVAANLVKAGTGKIPLEDAVLQICWPTTCASQENQIQDTVLVTGIKSTTRKEVLSMFFESKKRTGGGHIQNLTYIEGQGKAQITFDDPKDAVSVLKKSREQPLQLEDAHLQVKIASSISPPVNPNALLLTNLPKCTPSSTLMLYLENISGILESDIQLMYGQTPSVLLVTFSRNIDIGACKKKCLERRAKGKDKTLGQFNIETVTCANAVQAHGLKEDTLESTIELYFESKSGSSVWELKILTFNRTRVAVVTFEDYKVVDKVCKASPFIVDGQEVKVIPFYPCLGVSNPTNTAAPWLAIPSPIEFKAYQNFMKFLQAYSQHKRIWEDELKKCHAALGDVSDLSSLRVVCAITTEMPNAAAETAVWNDVVNKVVVQLFQQYAIKEVDVPKAFESMVCEHLGKWASRVMVLKTASKTMQLLGEREDVKRVVQEISEIVHSAQKKMEDEAHTESSSVSINHAVTYFLENTPFLGRLRQSFPTLQIEADFPNKAVRIKGHPAKMNEAKIQLFRFMEDIKTERISFPKSVLDFLRRDKCCEFLQDELQKKCQNVYFTCDSNAASIHILLHYSQDDSEILRASQLIQNKIVEKKIQLKEGCAAAIKDRKWQDKKDQLVNEYDDMVQIQVSPQMTHLTIVAFANSISAIENQVQSFLSTHSINDTFEAVDYPKALYIQKFRMMEINKIQHDLMSTAVGIDLKISEIGKCGFSIRGNPNGVKQAKRGVQDVVESIQKETVEFDQPAVASFYSNERGQITLKSIAVDNSCVVEKSGKRGARQTEMYASEFTHPCGVVFKVCKGDLTKYDTDAVVNTANENLAHGGGLDGAIKKAGGDAVQRECDDVMRRRGRALDAGDVEVTGPGRLHCKYILHAVGPRWKGGKQGEAGSLQKAIENILKKSGEERLESVAIPAVSAGLYGFPKAKATEIIVRTANDVCSKAKPDGLKEIHFVDQGGEVVHMFTSVASKLLANGAAGGGNISEEDEVGVTENENEEMGSEGNIYEDVGVDTDEEVENNMLQTDAEFMAIAGREKIIMTKERIKVTLKTGQIADEQVDVIVNTTQTNLDLSKGALSRALLEKAGRELQDELSGRNKYLKHGEITCSQGYRLDCLEVYHGACLKWDGGKGDAEKVLRSIIRNCLESAHKNGNFTSIAFPSIGTGGLSFPASFVAGAMFDEVKEFGIRNQNTRVKDIRFVIFGEDLQTVQDFELEMKRLQDGGKTKQSNVSGTSFLGSLFSLFSGGRDQEGDPTKQGLIYSHYSQSSRGFCQIMIGKMKIQVQTGDITVENVDAVINSTNDKLNLDTGGVSKAIKRAGGKEVEDACKAAGQTTDGFAVTVAGRMKCKRIIHVDGKHFHQNWRKAVRGCLSLAEDKKFKSVAMPAFGTGAKHHDSQDIVNNLMDGIADFLNRDKPRSMELVRITLNQKELLSVFQDVMKARQTGISKRQSQSAESERGGRGFKAQSKRPRTLELDIYYTNRSDLNKVREEIKRLAEKEMLSKCIENDKIGRLSKDQTKEIKDFAKGVDVEIIFEDRGRSRIIKLRGSPADVMKVQDVVQKKFDEIAKSQNQRVYNAAKLKDIQWTFHYKDKEYNFDPLKNAEIEEAYKKKKPEYEYTEKGRSFKLTFSDMQVCGKNGKSEIVRRKDLKAEGNFSVPSHWDKMPQGQGVSLVPLNSSSKEYKDVEQNFTKTGGGTPVQKIERIQNPKLYLPYIAKREEMKKRLPGKTVEHICYHGTDSNSTQFINNNGFNRSYCGKNGTALGAGVYFACQAATSLGYASGGAGGRFMYQARVLTGDYTGGSSSYKYAPKKPDGITDYDSVVNATANPSVFVIFHDSQAYPEYLITF